MTVPFIHGNAWHDDSEFDNELRFSNDDPVHVVWSHVLWVALVIVGSVVGAMLWGQMP